jgi:hypothetical protein
MRESAEAQIARLACAEWSPGRRGRVGCLSDFWTDAGAVANWARGTLSPDATIGDTTPTPRPDCFSPFGRTVARKRRGHTRRGVSASASAAFTP